MPGLGLGLGVGRRRARAAAAAAGYRHYRIYITEFGGAGYRQQLAEIEWRSGGVDQTGSGIASSSGHNGSNDPPDAFDNNINTFWETFGGSPPAWIAYDFGVATEIDAVAMMPTTLATAQRWPAAFEIQGSQDGVAWDTLLSLSGQTTPPASTFVVFNL